MQDHRVTQPIATRDGEEIVLQMRSGTDFVIVRMSPNDALEAIQQLGKALAMPVK